MDSFSPSVVRTDDDRAVGGQSFTFARTRGWTKPVTGGGLGGNFGINLSHARLRPRYRDERCRSADGYGAAA